jgi:hypothetical protein
MTTWKYCFFADFCVSYTQVEVGGCRCVSEDDGFAVMTYAINTVTGGTCACNGGGGGGGNDNTESSSYRPLSEFRKGIEWATIGTGVTQPSYTANYTASGSNNSYATFWDVPEGEDTPQETTESGSGSGSTNNFTIISENGAEEYKYADRTVRISPEGKVSDIHIYYSHNGNSYIKATTTTTNHAKGYGSDKPTMPDFTFYKTTKGTETTSTTYTGVSKVGNDWFKCALMQTTYSTSKGFKVGTTTSISAEQSCVTTSTTSLSTNATNGTGTVSTHKTFFTTSTKTYTYIIGTITSTSMSLKSTEFTTYVDSYWKTTMHTHLELDKGIVFYLLKSGTNESGVLTDFYDVISTGYTTKLTNYYYDTSVIHNYEAGIGDEGTADFGKQLICGPKSIKSSKSVFFTNGWSTSSSSGYYYDAYENSTDYEGLIPVTTGVWVNNGNPLYYSNILFALFNGVRDFGGSSGTGIFDSYGQAVDVFGASTNYRFSTTAKMGRPKIMTPSITSSQDSWAESVTDNSDDPDTLAHITRELDGESQWGIAMGGNVHRRRKVTNFWFRHGPIASHLVFVNNGWAVLNKSSVSVVEGVNIESGHTYTVATYTNSESTGKTFTHGSFNTALAQQWFLNGVYTPQNQSTSWVENNASKTISLYGGYVYYTTKSSSSSSTASFSIIESGSGVKAASVVTNIIPNQDLLGVPDFTRFGKLCGGVAPHGEKLTVIITPGFYQTTTLSNPSTKEGEKVDYSFLERMENKECYVRHDGFGGKENWAANIPHMEKF